MTVIPSSVAARHQRSASRASRAPDKHKRKKIYPTELRLVEKTIKPLKILQKEPPQHYIFVPAGNEAVTNFCRERSRESNIPIYVYKRDKTRAREDDPTSVPFQVGREGLWVNPEIVKNAGLVLGLRIDKRGQLILPSHELTRSLRSHQHNNKVEPSSVMAAMRELFPKMPEASAKEITSHAFTTKGGARVGQSDLTLVQSVQLAVNAHIRHIYTNYDAFLKAGVPWAQAREAVTSACVQKLKEWRGEDGKTEIKETFQEWIDLRGDSDDDYDDDDEDNNDDSPPNAQAPSQTASRLLNVHGSHYEHEHETLRPLRASPPEIEIVEERQRPLVRDRGERPHHDTVYKSIEKSPPINHPQWQSLPHDQPYHNSSHFLPLDRQSHYAHTDIQPHFVNHSAPFGTVAYKSYHQSKPSRVPGLREAEREVIDLTSSTMAPRQQELGPRYTLQPRPQHHYSSSNTHIGVPAVAAPSKLVPPLRGGNGYDLKRTRLELAPERLVERPARLVYETRPELRERDATGGAFVDDQGRIYRRLYEEPLHPDPVFNRQGLGEVRHVETGPEARPKMFSYPPPPPPPHSGWVVYNGR